MNHPLKPAILTTVLSMDALEAFSDAIPKHPRGRCNLSSSTKENIPTQHKLYSPEPSTPTLNHPTKPTTIRCKIIKSINSDSSTPRRILLLGQCRWFTIRLHIQAFPLLYRVIKALFGPRHRHSLGSGNLILTPVRINFRRVLRGNFMGGIILVLHRRNIIFRPRCKTNRPK